VPIFRSDEENAAVLEAVENLKEPLSAYRVHIDAREGITPGFKFNDWEMRGVPLRLELGPRDVEQGGVAVARRDIPGKEGKSFVALEDLTETIAKTLEDIQAGMLQSAREFHNQNTHEPDSYEAMKEFLETGWVDVWWCGDAECEAKIKNETKATLRCIPLDQPGGSGECIVCGEQASSRALFARGY